MKMQDLYTYFIQSTGICTDTRKLKKNNLFFALKGDNFNGNQFAKQAINHGALAAIVDEQEFADENQNIFWVEDSLSALQKLANHHRNQLKIPFIGLTGSNGKTTTKELIATCLSPKFKVAYTHGNLNNHIGVPLTLLSVNSSHDIAVIEMGANHLKEIEMLCQIAEPDYGYITNFGKAHLEGFGGVDGVINGKSELYKHLAKHDKEVFVFADDKIQMQKTQYMQRILFSFQNDSDYRFRRSSQSGLASISYKNNLIQSHLSGNYNETNLAAAVCMALHFHVNVNDIQKALDEYFPNLNRSQEIEKNGIKILKDAYNANPTSMEAALRNFDKLSGSKTLILGDMFELGEISSFEHQQIVNLAESLSFENHYFIGNQFNQSKVNSPKSLQFQSREEFITFLNENPIQTERALLKGSRGMALEKILDFMKA